MSGGPGGLDPRVEVRLAEALKELDLEARARHRRLLGGCLGLLLGIGLFAGLLALSPTAEWPGVVAVVAAAWFGWSAWSANRGFAGAFRERVIRPLVGLLDLGLSYDPAGSLGPEHLEASGLVRQPVGHVRGEDLVAGTIDGVGVSCAYVRAAGEVPPRRPGSDPGSPPTLYAGLFVVAEFPRRAAGDVYVLPDRAERLFGSAAEVLQAADRRYGSLVRLEDPEFERLFKVYADDQVEARYVLTTSLVARLVRFRRRRDVAPRLSIRGATLYMALPCETNPLAPPLWAEVAYTQKTEAGRERIRKRVAGYADDLRLALDVVRDLRLDVRIWTRDAAMPSWQAMLARARGLAAAD